MTAESFDLAFEDHQLRIRRVSAGATASATTLIFLHDSLGSIALWRDFPDRLAKRLELDAIVYDRRGYGESSPFGPEPRTPSYLEDEAEGLGRVLDRLGVSSAILVGHSDGGSIALVAAAMYPSVVRAVVTEGAHVFVEERTLAGIREAREALTTTNLREKVARYQGARTDSVLSAWIDTWLSPAFRDWSIESYLSRVVSPTLVIQGVEDEFGTEAQVRSIVKGVAGPAESLMIPGVRHTPHREAAEVVLEASASFIGRVLSGELPGRYD